MNVYIHSLSISSTLRILKFWSTEGKKLEATSFTILACCYVHDCITHLHWAYPCLLISLNGKVAGLVWELVVGKGCDQKFAGCLLVRMRSRITTWGFCLVEQELSPWVLTGFALSTQEEHLARTLAHSNNSGWHVMVNLLMNSYNKLYIMFTQICKLQIHFNKAEHLTAVVKLNL